MKRRLMAALLLALVFSCGGYPETLTSPVRGGTLGSVTSWRVPVLEYHDTTCPSGTPNAYSVCDATFRAQISAVLAAGYVPITARNLAKHMQDHTGIGTTTSKRVLISIDNSTLTRYTDTLPQLQDLGVAASFFIVTGRVGLPGYMTWDQVRALHAATPVQDIENHSVTHPRMSTLTYAAQLAEIEGAADEIQTEIGYWPPAFALPYGDYDADTDAALADSGTVLALSSHRGSPVVTLAGRYLINRIPAQMYPRPADLLAQMAQP